jgi:radical SAM superfamily enzyme YgiQ (UPF0313 family)
MSKPRVVLVNPPHSLEERYGAMKAAGNTMPSIGLLGMAAVLARDGFPVTVVDAPARGISYAQTMKEALEGNPQAVGMTAFTPSVFNAAKMARLLKGAVPGLPVALGGPHSAAVPGETVKMFDCFDAVAIGEGEPVISPLMEALAGRGDLSGIPGIFFRNGAEIRNTGPAPLVQDLDTLPFPAWNLAPGFPHAYRPAAHTHRRLPSATMFTTRGCPEQCRFCDRSVFGNSIRGFSAEYVVDQMEALQRDWGVRDLIIYDDIFPLLKPRLLKICGLIRSRGLNLTWSCNSRVNFAEPESLAAMRAAGCWQIGYGIESGDQAILDIIGKRIKLEQVERAVRLTEEAGIRAKGFFIIGHPGETLATIRTTIDFARKLRLSDYQTCFFTPFPGTDLHREADKYGTVVATWDRMNLLAPAFIPAGLTADDLEKWAARSYREFYLRPRIVWRYLSGIRSPYHVIQILRGGFALLSSLVRAAFHRMVHRKPGEQPKNK